MRKQIFKCRGTGLRFVRISLRVRGQTRAGIRCEYEALD
jgi:hypothetical protein